MAKLLTILLMAIFFEAVGVVFLSRGLKQIGDVKQISAGEISRLVVRGITNRDMILGVFFEALFFIGLLMLMSKSDVSFVWPMTSVGFVATTLAAKFFLHEQVPSARWAGVLLITIGAALVSWSEAKQEADPKPGASSIQSNA